MSKKTNLNKYLPWLIPIGLFFILVIVFKGIKSRSAANRVGKPQVVVAQNYGKIDKVNVKPGDVITPGQLICNYVVTDAGGKVENKVKEKYTNVTTHVLNGKVFTDEVELPGIIGASVETTVSSQIGGTVKELYVNDGYHVKKGDIIASVDPSDYIINLESAKASYNLAEINFKRIKKLLNQQAISTAEFDKAKANFSSAKARLDQAKLALSRCSIYSPITGIVDKKYTECGELLSPGKKIVTIIDISTVKVKIGIPEQDVDYVRKLKKVDFLVKSLNNKRISGDVNHISLSTNSMAKVYPMEVDVDNSNEALLPGMVVKAFVIRHVYKDSIILPIFSVIPGDNEYYTYVVEDGVAVKRVLKLGTFQEKSVQILSGLNPGDKIIDKGLRLVADGSKVQIVNE